MSNKVPVPLAIRYLIQSNNELLEVYRRELSSNVVKANEEVMNMLGLPIDKWQLNIDTMEYVEIDRKE